MENQDQLEFNEMSLPQIPGIEDFDMAEWMFQFDEEEPIVFAWSNSEEEAGEVSFVLKANSGSTVFFQSSDGSKTFKLFARRMPEERRAELRELRQKEEELIQKMNSENPQDETGL